jgi:hypothetical protein
MVYENVEQLYAYIDKQRERLIASVASLTEEQAASRRAPEAWTINEIVEHLSVTENSLLRAINKLLEKAETDGNALENKGALTQPFSLESFTGGAQNTKFNAPDFLLPNKAASLASSLESLNQSRAAIHELRARVEAIDLSETTFPHPAFGPLNLYQWIVFIGIHEAHHLRQIKETLEANQPSE